MELKENNMELNELAKLLDRSMSGAPAKVEVEPTITAGRVEGIVRLYLVDRRGWWYKLTDFKV